MIIALLLLQHSLFLQPLSTFFQYHRKPQIFRSTSVHVSTSGTFFCLGFPICSIKVWAYLQPTAPATLAQSISLHYKSKFKSLFSRVSWYFGFFFLNIRTKYPLNCNCELRGISINFISAIFNCVLSP